MQKVVHRASERGVGEHGWLSTRLSFSFADWFNKDRMGFGALRVLNDDTIFPLGKFSMHPHENFEIVTVPLSGAVTHEDNLGNKGVVGVDEVQAISAGTGVLHSEGNASSTEILRLFQIWIEPKALGVSPRYSQAAFRPEERKNAWQVLASGDGVAGSVPLQQDARIARARVSAHTELAYTRAYSANGIYLFVITGTVTALGVQLAERDALGVTDVSSLALTAHGDADVLVIEVPMRS